MPPMSLWNKEEVDRKQLGRRTMRWSNRCYSATGLSKLVHAGFTYRSSGQYGTASHQMNFGADHA